MVLPDVRLQEGYTALTKLSFAYKLVAILSHAVLGCVVGCAIGLPLSKSLYDFLIAGHFPSAVWQFPIISLGVILLFVSIAAIAAVYAPAKRIRNMSITATINEL